MAQIPTIDVRKIVPRERHPLIFGTYSKLKDGDAFELVSAHGGALEFLTDQPVPAVQPVVG